MKPERLFRALSDVGEDLIARADAPVEKQRVPWVRWAGLAACCALVVGLAALALPHLGFGAKSVAPDIAQGVMLQDTRSAGQDMTQATTEEAEAPESMAEWAAEAPAEESKAAPMEEPLELPAEEPAPEPAEAPAPEPQENADKNVLTGTQTPSMEPARTDNLMKDAGSLLTDYEFTSATLQISGVDAPVTVTGEALTALLEQLRALPSDDAGGEQEGIAPMTLRFYEQDRLCAVVTLPCFSVSAAEDAAQLGCLSETSQALYEQLVKDWFADK